MMPENVSKIVTWVVNLLTIIIKLLPSIPNFDTRGILVIISFGVPLAIDLATVWFVKPFLFAILHIVDVIALVLLSYSIAVFVFGSATTLYILLFTFSLLYIIIRFTIYLFTRKPKKMTIQEIVQDIKNYFLAGILPDVKNNKSFFEIDSELREFSGYIEISAIVPKIWEPIAYVVSSIVILIVSLILGVVIKIPGFKVPVIVRSILPFIGYVFAIITFIIGILKFFLCGNRFLLSVKKFARRWAVYLMMFLLSMLYIPIITSSSDSVGVTKSSCPVGTFPNKTKNLDDPFDMFVSHTFECLPCNLTAHVNSSYCSATCNGINFTSILKEKDLHFVNDVLYPCLPAMIYCLVIFVLGIPFLWWYIIYKNTKLMKLIPAYGYSTEDKWNTLTSRMKSTGIYLFDEFRYNMEFWSIYDFFAKAIIVIIAYLAKHFEPKVVFGFPIYFLVFFVVLLIVTPYIFKLNNIYDISLYFFNFLFTIIPLMYHFGVKIPIWLFYVICALALAIPFIIIAILVVVFRHKKSHINNFDPTIVKKLSKREVADRNARIQSGAAVSMDKFFMPVSVKNNMKNEDNKPRGMQGNNNDKQKNAEEEEEKVEYYLDNKKDDMDEFSDEEFKGADFYMGDNEGMALDNRRMSVDLSEKLSSPEDAKEGKVSASGQLEIEENDRIKLENLKEMLNIDAFVYQNLPEDFDTITASILSTIEEIDAANADLDNFVPLKKENIFSVNKHMLARRIQAMYQVMDIILDGNTMEYLFKILNLAVLVGSLIFGWYSGSIIQYYNRTYENCN
ncbi:hypothetical protein TVAG_343630 [Trichomonas vaginalis G3]|uniref:TRP C-terminal domain-containing protein n=1 Tax=Trichomonas vaginalis (strain ATCC PRA-98 / G3) TaxID=412133 RepID=A2E1G7_TRIV3|nr:hypothetical protein TVAGG3_0319580 [Trichomonas vaginalis G3]EAY13534.1 hypothetical protein TVAG_343630 [Trichomonas vaginalis G3]KAI5529190.1 hypothetical protein TVAGG3_0319580 [Trichomonas vaginalis G3]|eukprot:XP_001325757.1 hypothetical protein [Trichomonas vaginalis G3]